MQKHKAGFYEKYSKRILDFLLSLIAIVILSPIILITALLVRIKLGSPVIFCQKRPGKDEKIFSMYKFRSMTDEKDENGNLLPDDVRLTQFGKKLRATSLDELPELFNILKGDMSIVGPRPLMARYLEYYNDEERLRHKVRPGLTGYAQVHGRNNVSWDERMKQDVYYTKNISIQMDIKVIIDTIWLVLKREGTDNNNMENFDDFRKRQWEDEKRK